MGSILFPLIIAPLKHVVSSKLKHTLPFKVIFDDRDTNILRMCVHILLIVQLNLKVYLVVSNYGDFVFTLKK